MYNRYVPPILKTTQDSFGGLIVKAYIPIRPLSVFTGVEQSICYKGYIPLRDIGTVTGIVSKVPHRTVSFLKGTLSDTNHCECITDCPGS